MPIPQGLTLTHLEYFERELRPTKHRGRRKVPDQLRSREIKPRIGLLRWLNRGVDRFNCSWMSDIPPLVFFTLLIFFGTGWFGSPLTHGIVNLIGGWFVEDYVEPVDQEHCWDIVAEWGAGEATVVMRMKDGRCAGGASSPTDSPAGGVLPPFKLDWSRSGVILWAILLGFSRWHIKNKQDTLSEAFERKRATNEFIVDKQDELEEMLSSATEPIDRIVSTESISPESCEECLKDILNDGLCPAKQKEEFTQRMFVFFELDNLEFAYDKHQANLLDDFQMLRACQVFESRCLNARFRCLALVLGEGNYDPRFLHLSRILVIYGCKRPATPAA